MSINRLKSRFDFYLKYVIITANKGGNLMKNLQVTPAFWSTKKKMAALGLGIALMVPCLTACAESDNVRIVTNSTKSTAISYSVIPQEKTNIEPQVLDVPGENFKLVVEYDCDEGSKEAWTITGGKILYITTYTNGLDENTKVWIDNVHMDISLIASNQNMSDIVQDSMDDSIHNSQMIGFPISDTTKYYGVNAINSSNESFITESFHGLYSLYDKADERRYKENDYLDAGVYANKISTVFDLLIQGPNDLEPRNVSVISDVTVLSSNQLIRKELDENMELIKATVYEYDRSGTREEIATYSAEEYEQAVSEGKIKKKTLTL